MLLEKSRHKQTRTCSSYKMDDELEQSRGLPVTFPPRPEDGEKGLTCFSLVVRVFICSLYDSSLWLAYASGTSLKKWQIVNLSADEMV